MCLKTLEYKLSITPKGTMVLLEFTHNYIHVRGYTRIYSLLLYTNNDQTLVNPLHGLLNCEIDGLDTHLSLYK